MGGGSPSVGDRGKGHMVRAINFSISSFFFCPRGALGDPSALVDRQAVLKG